MRITLVTGEFPVLSQPFIVHKALSLARHGLQVTVMATGRGDARFYRALLEDRPTTLAVRYLPARGAAAAGMLRLPGMVARALRRSAGDTARLLALLRARYRPGPALGKQLYRLLPFVGERPHLLHFEFAGKAAELIELFDLLPCPKMVSCRGADVSIMPLVDEALAVRLRCVFERADRVHCVSQEILERARDFGLDPERAFVNHPSIDVRYFVPSRPSARGGEPPVILSVGRLHWKKGYEYALQAIRLLRDRGHSVRYQIAGTGPAEDAVRFACWELGLEREVELLGPQPRERVRELLNEADLYLLPSVSEGLSNAVLEAMAMELPVVTTAAGGMAEAVRDGQDGFVVPTRSPELMAERLARLLHAPALRAEIGRNARRRVEDHFTLERQTERFIREYRDILGIPFPLPQPILVA